MNRENKYTIEILFNKSENELMLKNNIEYIGSKIYKDTINIYANSITIEGYRSSKINLNSIFYNHNSSLYNQIIKTLIYYYATIGKYVSIKEITVTRSRNNKTFETKTLSKSNLKEILSPDFSMQNKISKDKLKEIFSENDKGKSLFRSISYLLKANSIQDAGDKFERLWKSFNSIYKLIGQEVTEQKNLRELRTFILSNQECLKYSNRITDKISEKDLTKLRWIKLMKNNWGTENKTEDFKEFIKRHSDCRIMKMFKNKLSFREKYLKTHNYYTEVTTHIEDNISDKTIINAEVISIICIKYLYFIRNKSFHGENLDHSFRLAVNNEITELEWTNKLLESFIIDLINCNNEY